MKCLECSTPPPAEEPPCYPIVRCDRHPYVEEPGYAVCKHLAEGARVAHQEGPTPARLGVMLCLDCLMRQRPPNRQTPSLVLRCAACVREKFPKERI